MERTQPGPTDEGIRRLIKQPSYATQALVVTARVLEMDADQPMTGTVRERAIDVAADTILRTLPDAVCRDSLARLYRVLPPMAPITRGEYALRLRAAAKALG